MQIELICPVGVPSLHRRLVMMGFSRNRYGFLAAIFVEIKSGVIKLIDPDPQCLGPESERWLLSW